MADLALSWTLYLMTVILLALSAMLLYMTRNFKYWAKRGVCEEKPIPFFGNFFACTLFRKPASTVIADIYVKHKGHDQVGFYIYDKPCLLVRDVDLVHRILVRDFQYFSNRHVSAGDHDPLGAANLFTIKNPHWKNLRAKLSPTMTSGKLKKMFQQMVSVGEDLNTYMKSLKLEGEGQVLELREISAKYATDVIATCAYGLQVNSLTNPDAEFRACGKKIFDYNLKRGFELGACFFAPGIVKPLGLMFFEKTSSEFLRKALWETLTQRMESGVRRNDLIDILIELKKAQAQADIDDPDSFKFDGDNLIAQAAIFFTGGFETTSSTIAFTLYELALQPDIQSRLREEIISALEKNGGELNYEWVTQLPYLDMVVSETLRKYPLLGFLDRVAINDYKVPGSDFVIEKGTPVFISAAGLHYDPEYFPDPEKYHPERFGNENKQKQALRAYMPFGLGPRNCIGLRFGLMSIKTYLVRIITVYEFTPCKDTVIPICINPRSVITSMKYGLFLNVKRVNTARRQSTAND